MTNSMCLMCMDGQWVKVLEILMDFLLRNVFITIHCKGQIQAELRSTSFPSDTRSAFDIKEYILDGVSL